MFPPPLSRRLCLPGLGLLNTAPPVSSLAPPPLSVTKPPGKSIGGVDASPPISPATESQLRSSMFFSYGAEDRWSMSDPLLSPPQAFNGACYFLFQSRIDSISSSFNNYDVFISSPFQLLLLISSLPRAYVGMIEFRLQQV